jgi:hypothetical protein
LVGARFKKKKSDSISATTESTLYSTETREFLEEKEYRWYRTEWGYVRNKSWAINVSVSTSNKRSENSQQPAGAALKENPSA